MYIICRYESQGLIQGQTPSKRASSLDEMQEEGSLSFIDELVNLSKKRKPKYVSLANYKLCSYCKSEMHS